MNKLTTEQFIQKALKVHGDKYDYSLVEYKNSHIKVIIICPIHGQFLQRSSAHLDGQCCKKCFINKQQSNIEEFINKANLIHKNKYDYSKFIYINSKIKGIIICPNHDEFLQIPNKHLRKRGCPKCIKTKLLTKKEFIEKANKIHNFKYDYSESTYINNKTKLIIICSDHGEFNQSPNSHLNKQGCPLCKNNKTGWTHIKWNQQSKISKNFDSYKIYLIKCWNEEEEFYKIGKTFVKLNNRINNKRIPYEYKIIKIFESKNDGINISKLEKQLHRKYKEFKYIPKIKFDGMQECFSFKINNIELI